MRKGIYEYSCSFHTVVSYLMSGWKLRKAQQEDMEEVGLMSLNGRRHLEH